MRKNMTPPKFILLLWPAIDKLLRVIRRIKPLKADSSSIISLDLRRYNSRPIMLNDGSEVKTGDIIIELHMDNAWFKSWRKLDTKASHSLWEIPWCLKQDLRFLAQQVVNGMYKDVVALHGCTFHDKEAKRLGFQVKDLADTLWKKASYFYIAGLMLRAGKKESKLKKRPLELKEAWLSRAALLTRYGPKHQ